MRPRRVRSTGPNRDSEVDAVDLLSIIGIILGAFAVFGGAMLEGIHLTSILIPTAAMIVFGGTIGAVCLQSSGEEMRWAKALLPRVFKKDETDHSGIVREILELSKVARRDGMLALESKMSEIENPFLVKALGLLIDGVAAEELRSRLEIAMTKDEEKFTNAARVYEAGGGYAPTVGILGAVLGLIHVMQSLDDPSKLGSGIAVAFVATVYGVGSANLIFLPICSKLKSRGRAEVALAELILEGVVGIAEGQPTSALEQTLILMTGEDHGKKGQDAANQAA